MSAAPPRAAWPGWRSPAAPPPPTTTTSSPRRRRPARGRDRGGPRSRACGSTRAAARWTSASPAAGCRRTGGGGHRRDPGRHRGGDRPLPRPVAGRDAADRRRALLAVLGHRRPDARGGRAGPRRACGCTPTSPRPLDEEEFCRETFGCRPVELLEDWAGSGPTCGSPTACTSTTRTSVGSRATGTGVAHCPTSNARLGVGHRARRRAPARAGVPVGLGVDGAASNEPGDLLGRAAPGAAVQPGRRWPAGLTVREALGLATLGGGRVPGPGRRDRLAGAGQAGRRRAVARGRPRPRRHRADPVAALVLGGPAGRWQLLVEGRPVVRRRPAGRPSTRSDIAARGTPRRRRADRRGRRPRSSVRGRRAERLPRRGRGERRRGRTACSR